MKIATGEEFEDYGADDGKDPAAKSLGQRGGKVRAASLSKKCASTRRFASPRPWPLA